MKQELSKFESAKLDFETFCLGFRTLQMATVDDHGLPNASYSPYVKHESNYYIYVSELSEHTKNLVNQRKASIFFVENEADSQHIFARRRITFNCNAIEVSRTDSEFDHTMNLFSDRFGEKFINMIRGLEDFHLFQLNPQSGIFVNGFAQAYTISGEGMSELNHKNDVGHRPTNKETKEQMSNSAG